MDIQELTNRNIDTGILSLRSVKDVSRVDEFNGDKEENPGVFSIDTIPRISSLIELSKPFIEANTIEANIDHLRNDCIIPVFSKDNEKTIAHQEFIDVVLEATQKAFPMHSFTTPEIRVSHQVKGESLKLFIKM